MISALQFVDILEEKDLLPPELVRLLRDRINSSSEPVTAIDVAKRLIAMGRLTSALAERILTASYKQPKVEVDELDELSLAPLEDEPAPARQAQRPAAKQPEKQKLEKQPDALRAAAGPRGAGGGGGGGGGDVGGAANVCVWAG